MNDTNSTGRLNPGQTCERSVESSEAGDRVESGMPRPVTAPPLIGRDGEFSLLIDRWDRTQEGIGQVVLVVGEAGLGKSRLVRTITQLVQQETAETFRPGTAGSSGVLGLEQNPFIIEWRCSQHFQNSELYPVSDFMERFLGFAQDQSSTARFDLLAAHLEAYGLGRPECVGLFAKLLFLPPGERYLAAGFTPAREREETFRLLCQWFSAHSAKGPVLFIVEDLHWSDASTLEFLGQVIGEGPPERMLTVLTFRPEFKIPWPAAAQQTTLPLNRLTRRQVTEWIRGDSSDRWPDSLVAQIYERTGGVPLLVEEFTRMVRESAAFACSSEDPASNLASRSREIPATLQDLVIARLNRMSSNRETVQLAAVLGREFDYELIAAVATMEEQHLRNELAKLVSANILYVEGQPPRCTYLFKHALLEEALYTAIDESTRQRLHQQIAEEMEERFTRSADMPPELLAEHFIRAGIIPKAVEYCLKAGLRSRGRFANAEAVSHFNKGLELLKMLDPSPDRDARELELLSPLGTSYIAWRGYAAPEVGPVFRRAHSLCERGAQTPQIFAIMWGNFAFHIVRGDFAICTELAEEAVAFGERLNDPGIMMEALFLRGVTRLYRGDFAGVRECCAEAISDFDDRERTAFWAALVGEDAGITHRCYLALALWHLGLPDQALRLNGETLELARTIDQPFSLEYALHHTAWLHQHCRLGRRAQAFGEEQMRIGTEQGFLFWHASGTLYAASGLLLQGRLERGLRLLQEGLEAYRATGAQLGLPYYLSILADACMQIGRFAEAGTALNEAIMLAEKNDDRFQEAELYRLKGELLLAQSDERRAAEECFLRAVQTADRQHSKAWKLRATMSLARLWQKQGRREAAFTALRDAYGMFMEGFTMPDLVDAAALLENLTTERMRAEFAAGVKYVRDCIPPPIGGLVSVDWRYVPASTLGGDTIGYYWVDSAHLVLYLIDVTGHGLDSALLSVSINNVIRSGALSGADVRRPDQVLAQLNDAFRGEQHGNKYFTIWYGVYHSATRTLTWAAGGHPPSVLLDQGEPNPLVLSSEGLMMGVLRAQEFRSQSCQVPPEARLLIFSDGVFEIIRGGRQVWNLAGFISHLPTLAKGEGNLMDPLLQHVQRLRGSPHLDDDFSIIEARFH